MNELIALVVFLKGAVQGSGRGMGKGKKKAVAVRKERVTNLCRHLTVQV